MRSRTLYITQKNQDYKKMSKTETPKKKAGDTKSPAKKTTTKKVEKTVEETTVDKTEKAEADAKEAAEKAAEAEAIAQAEAAKAKAKITLDTKGRFEFENVRYQFTSRCPKKVLLNGRPQTQKEIVADEDLLILVLHSFLKKRFIRKIK